MQNTVHMKLQNYALHTTGLSTSCVLAYSRVCYDITRVDDLVEGRAVRENQPLLTALLQQRHVAP